MQSIKDAPIKEGTRVLVRADIDVPIVNGQIQDSFRLDKCLPTLKYLESKKAHIIIAGKIGRPEGKFNPELSTRNIIPYFRENLSGTSFEILENLRFDPREEESSEEFARELAKNAQIYVNECFATSHREDTSIYLVPKLLPSYAGLRLEQEVETLKKVIKDPKRPLVSIIGGAKLGTKRPVVSKFLQISDFVLIGGKIGLDWDTEIPENLILPVDYTGVNQDIGPQTVSEFIKIIKIAKTVIWNGPMGLFEVSPFEHATNELARVIADHDSFSIIGGGDTIHAINALGILDKFDFVSTGGGAMLEFITNENLPGLEVLGYHG